jgi:phosphoribosylformylglycinamidine synthase PurS subunit
MRFRAEVVVSLKEGLLDPQGKAVEASLPALGWTNVTDVRIGRHVQLDVEATDREAALALVDELSVRLLSNPVIETYRVMDVVELVGLNGKEGR